MQKSTLADFLQSKLNQPTVYGVDDCCLWLADWWRACHGFDPAANLRGAYGDRRSLVLLVLSHGGLVRLVAGIAKRAGARSVAVPGNGTMAVVKAHGKRVGAIYVDGFWAVRTATGIGFVRDAVMLRGWSL